MNKEEFIKKLTNAKSVDDVIALAKENGLEIAPDKAKELFDKINELSDDELDNVAGGRKDLADLLGPDVWIAVYKY